MNTIPSHEIGPGSTIVLRYQQTLCPTTREEIAARMREKFPDANVLILDSGAEIAVIRPAAA